MHGLPDLTFSAVDELAFNAAGSNAACPHRYDAARIGPLIELALLAAQGRTSQRLPQTVESSPLGAMVEPACRNVVVELGGLAGFIRLDDEPVPQTELTKLSVVAKRAALAAGFDNRGAGQLAAALGELMSNIIEHSQATDTGVVGYQAINRTFEFTVADHGVGALGSLRSNPRFAFLASEREALPMVLHDGCSRLDEPDRGHGFEDIFRGLANHNGSLRFRSGDAAVLIDGRSPGTIRPKVKQKPYLKGFLASISCSP